MPTLPASELCSWFRGRAIATHDLIAFSHSVPGHLGVSEETITDVNLVELARAFPAHVATRKYTKKQESNVSGADWLWAIGRPGRWLSLLVQAKIARPHSKYIPKLHYGKGQQRKTLVRYALRNNLVPLYVVYTGNASYPTTPSRKALAFYRFAGPCGAVMTDAREMGCVLVRPGVVAQIHRGPKPITGTANLLQHGLPWATMFCCTEEGASGELADVALAGVRRLPSDLDAARETETNPDDPNSAEPDDVPELSGQLITAGPPDVVADILAGKEPSECPPLAGVSILSSVPLDEPSPPSDDP